VQGVIPSKVENVYRVLEERIFKGVWPVGTFIPAESELMREFACGRSTVGTAIARLAHEGLVERRKRAGTRVLRNSFERGADLNALDAFAFIYPGEQHEGIWRTVKGFQDAAREKGRRVLMLSTGADYAQEAEFIGRLSEFDVRGAVVYPIIPSSKDLVHFSDMLVNSKFPIVLAEINLPGLGCPSVVVDGFHAGFCMTHHMLSRGARRIGYFSNYAWAPFMWDRYQGYRWALEEAGLREPANGVFLSPAMNPDFANPLNEPTQLASEFLSRAPKLDGVVCADDFLARGCMVAAKARGLRIPDDLLVTGIDNCSGLENEPGPSLTTYRVPFEERGHVAFRILNELVVGTSPRSFETRIRGELVVRESA